MRLCVHACIHACMLACVGMKQDCGSIGKEFTVDCFSYFEGNVLSVGSAVRVICCQGDFCCRGDLSDGDLLSICDIFTLSDVPDTYMHALTLCCQTCCGYITLLKRLADCMGA